MTELTEVEFLMRGAGTRHPELKNQIEALGKSALLSLCELTVHDPEPNASRLNQLHLGQALSVEPEALKTVYEIAVLARLALHIVKAALPDAAKLENQLKTERERHGLARVSNDHVHALASAAVERRGSDQ